LSRISDSKISPNLFTYSFINNKPELIMNQSFSCSHQTPSLVVMSTSLHTQEVANLSPYLKIGYADRWFSWFATGPHVWPISSPFCRYVPECNSIFLNLLKPSGNFTYHRVWH
jgi:hypothetical protein